MPVLTVNGERIAGVAGHGEFEFVIEDAGLGGGVEEGGGGGRRGGGDFNRVAEHPDAGRVLPGRSAR